MGTSYIFMLTAFYVDNGKTLPLWKELPQIAFWLLPAAVGVPLILYMPSIVTLWFWPSTANMAVLSDGQGEYE